MSVVNEEDRSERYRWEPEGVEVDDGDGEVLASTAELLEESEPSAAQDAEPSEFLPEHASGMWTTYTKRIAEFFR